MKNGKEERSIRIRARVCNFARGRESERISGFFFLGERGVDIKGEREICVADCVHNY